MKKYTNYSYGFLHACNTVIISKEVLHINIFDLGCILITTVYTAKKKKKNSVPCLHCTISWFSVHQTLARVIVMWEDMKCGCCRSQNPLHLCPKEICGQTGLDWKQVKSLNSNPKWVLGKEKYPEHLECYNCQ